MSSAASTSLIGPDTKIKVSSTLDKSVGKKYLTDGSSDTCWTSQHGLPQSVQLSFPSLIVPHAVSLTFQGGFVGSQCEIWITAAPAESDWLLHDQIFPEDVNRAQLFAIKPLADPIQQIKLVFLQSTDFFGRITIYDLQILGITA